MHFLIDKTSWLRGPLSSVGLCAHWLSNSLHDLHSERSDWTLHDVSRANIRAKTPEEKKRMSSLRPLTLSEKFLGDKKAVYHSVDTILPHFLKGKKVATVHDCWTLRENFWQSKEFQKKKKAKIEKSLSRADALITTTQHVKNQLLELHPEFEGRVHKIPLGPILNFTNEGIDLRSKITKDAPVAKYLAKGRPYFLCVANFENRKNHSLLFEAMKQVPGVDLVLVGAKGFGWENVSKAFAEHSASFPCFHFEGLSQGALSQLYKSCRALVQPSFDEGFGLPACEALFFDKPLILSQIPPFYEIASEAALYFDPHKGLNDLVSYLHALSQDDEFAKNLSLKCESRKHLFQWKQIAKAHLQVYRDLC